MTHQPSENGKKQSRRYAVRRLTLRYLILTLFWVGCGLSPSWGEELVFDAPQAVVSFPQNASQLKFLLADLGGDGRRDIVSSHKEATGYDGSIIEVSLGWHENKTQSAPSFEWHLINTIYGDTEVGPMGAECPWIGAGDMDGDGRTDVLCVRYAYDLDFDGHYWRNLSLFTNQIGAAPSFLQHIIINKPPFRRGVVTDLNNDGHLDVLAINVGVGWYKNDGAYPPKFTEMSRWLSNIGEYIVPTDLDADGDTDILGTSSNTPKFRWYEHNGQPDPGFTSHSLDLATTGPLSVADLSGDCWPDLVVGGYYYQNLAQRPPAFAPARRIGPPDKTLAADLDGDGDLDLVSLDGTWIENADGHGATMTSHTLALPPGAGRLDDAAVADMDGDANPDIVAQWGETIYLYTNPLPRRSVEVLEPTGEGPYDAGLPLRVRWRTELKTAGTAVGLELWQGLSKVASLGSSFDAGGEGVKLVRLPAVAQGGWYRIRAASLWNPSLFGFSESAFVVLPHRAGIEPPAWRKYD